MAHQQKEQEVMASSNMSSVKFGNDPKSNAKDISTLSCEAGNDLQRRLELLESRFYEKDGHNPCAEEGAEETETLVPTQEFSTTTPTTSQHSFMFDQPSATVGSRSNISNTIMADASSSNFSTKLLRTSSSLKSASLAVENHIRKVQASATPSLQEGGTEAAASFPISCTATTTMTTEATAAAAAAVTTTTNSIEDTIPLLVQHDQRSNRSLSIMSNLASPALSNMSSNQTLPTSHRSGRQRIEDIAISKSNNAKKREEEQVIVLESPPTLVSPRKGGVLVHKQDHSTSEGETNSKPKVVRSLNASKQVKRKSVPTKRLSPSIKERQPKSTVSNVANNNDNKYTTTPPAKKNSCSNRKRIRVEGMATGSSITCSSPKQNFNQNSMDATSRGERSNPSRNVSKKSNKAPPNNKLIDTFFFPKLKGTNCSQGSAVTTTLSARRPRSMSKINDNNSIENPGSAEENKLSPQLVKSSDTSSSKYINSSREIENLRQKLQEVEQSCKDKDEQLKAVANNQTIMHTTIRAALSQREKELDELKQKFNEKTDVSNEVIESLVRSECSREAKELREKLAADGARLGRIVYTRAGLHAVESWEEGHAGRQLKKRRLELKSKRETMEKRFEAARRAANAVRFDKENTISVEDKDYETVGGIVVKDALSAMEAEESARLHLDMIKQQEIDLAEEERCLHEEKGAHIRNLKRVSSEENSRFKSRPKLHGRYILLALLGKGGFSEVWRAYDLSDFREVAVKIHQLDPRWPDSKKENYTKHVSREYEIHRDVRYPRIVSLYDVFEIDNNSFATVLELCKGTDLDTLLKKKKMLPERDARAILLQILTGMLYLSNPSPDGSRQGIIHYDLKPGNILFDENGDAKITDFGLSKIVDAEDPTDSMELTSQGAGTYWYLPPECFITHHSVRISNKVDVWSIGVIYYQMLYGRRPFGDGQSQEKILSSNTMLNAREVKFPDNPVISLEGKEFIQQCLTYDQSFRPTISQICASPYVIQQRL